MAAPSGSRGSFGSNLGFILAAAGSAIGLGNIWGFPYMAAQSGGGAFVLLYLICVASIGLPVLLAELSIGRSTQMSPVAAFAKLAPGSRWSLLGSLGVATGFAILAFYAVIAGWTVGYLYKAVTGQFGQGLTFQQSTDIFTGLTSSPVQSVFWTAVFFLFTMLVVRGGVSAGIERASKILMPIFFLLLAVLVLRSSTLAGAGEGFRFLFHFDFSKVSGTVVMNALAQALFSMSLGMGAMITYGSYLSKKENVAFAGGTVALFDTGIALMAGLMIFPALFAGDASPQITEGAIKVQTMSEAGVLEYTDINDMGIVFQVLPTIFDDLPAGTLFGIAFYVLLGVAALTSAISLLEVVVAYFVDSRGWKREKSTWVLGTACFVVAAGCAAYGPFMNLLVQIFYIYALAIGAMLICWFTGWRWGTGPAVAELKMGGGIPFLGVWALLIRYVCPLATAIIVGYRIWLLITSFLG